MAAADASLCSSNTTPVVVSVDEHDAESPAVVADGAGTVGEVVADAKTPSINTGFPAVPDSWMSDITTNIDGLSAAIETDDILKIEGCFNAHKVQEDAKEEEAIPALEQALKVAAIDLNGVFPTRGAVGSKWNKAKSSDPALAKAYADLGKGYDAQREFRAQWVKKLYQETRERRIRTTTLSETVESRGVYEPFAVIVAKEGGDAAGRQAALNYTVACLRFHQAGRKCGPQPWLCYNQMTRRMEFLYVKKEFKQSFMESWAA